MKKIFLILLLFIPLTVLADVWIRGFGSKTCGEALADVSDFKVNRTIYSAFLDGYITHSNYVNNTFVTRTFSPATIEQLWMSKCSQPENITKQFVLIADEILFEAKLKKQ